VDTYSVFAKWLNAFPWLWFCTFTFKRPCKKRALKYVEALLWHMRHVTEGHPVMWAFAAEEYHKNGDRLHVHALIGTTFKPELLSWHEAVGWWREHFGRCKVETYKDGGGASAYCAKYILKEQGEVGEWDFFIVPKSQASRVYSLFLQKGCLTMPSKAG